MFFSNWSAGKDPKKCADNDGHNVSTRVYWTLEAPGLSLDD
jgi:hypothetical protein